ncbi:MAG: bifunctional glutamate N-acetyltransferase/amino-acid acetyltransferase ArgJ [Oscillospiraceae bacterium]|jgi:glutamate N-acetyltransferase/amino-acid N-acetyltransferase|nr:bifunctional glutamate N-acetyltransferase/amino-acid acetyltransferase ArgJ [Oscillospiraceae bacterium]
MQEKMQPIPGGVCAARGFQANGVCCGIRPKGDKPDLALIYSEAPAAAAAVYTQNLVKGAPLLVTKEHLRGGTARAIICNSGNANTCNADGVAVAERMCALAGEYTKVPPEEIIVASTGVIGVPLPIGPIQNGMPPLAAGLSRSGGGQAARAIMTTDTYPKECAVAFTLSGGAVCRIGGMAKGSGMIHPNMATMLVFLTTDAAIAPELLRELLKLTANDTFNMISVDGDTSTNDMCCILANGLAGNAAIAGPGNDREIFRAALYQVMANLAKQLAADGEGATKLITCHVSGAATTDDARKLAKSVIGSNLLKCAIFGADANWGRVLCALGYAGVDLDVTKIGVRFRSAAGELAVCENGAGLPFSEEKAALVLAEREIALLITCGAGSAEATAWGCDLTYDYVKINGDYRT